MHIVSRNAGKYRGNCINEVGVAELTAGQIRRYENAVTRERRVASKRHLPRGVRGVAPTKGMLVELAYRLADPCVYCGAPSEHWDHMESRHRGGWNHIDNLIRACARCNTSKRTRSPLVYLAMRRLGWRK